MMRCTPSSRRCRKRGVSKHGLELLRPWRRCLVKTRNSKTRLHPRSRVVIEPKSRVKYKDGLPHTPRMCVRQAIFFSSGARCLLDMQSGPCLFGSGYRYLYTALRMNSAEVRSVCKGKYIFIHRYPLPSAAVPCDSKIEWKIQAGGIRTCPCRRRLTSSWKRTGRN